MKDTKRNKHITVNLTESENDIINRLCELYDRTPADMARILITKSALNTWATVQAQQHPAEPLTPIKYR